MKSISRRGLLRLRTALSSVRALGEANFRSEGARLLLATNALHADIPIDAAGSGFMGWLLVMLAQQHGFPVPVGGADQLTAAMVERFTNRGGTLICDAAAEEVIVRDGRAVGVRMQGGEFVPAGRAVLADVSAPQLYGDLLRSAALPKRLRRAMQDFRWDPATFKIDWALDSVVPWATKPTAMPGTVHLTDSMTQLTEAGAQLRSGAVPAEPLLIMGQMTTSDPKRSPAGTESAWAYVHLPQEIAKDAGKPSISGRWADGDSERLADRIQARIDKAAPGFSSSIAARRILTPADLQAHDRNLVNGALNGGTAALHQQIVFRPVPGLGRAETPVRNLYLASASAHPGGGVHGAPGNNAARAALGHALVQRRR